jgi:ABC-type transporter Mla subunit MlaD
MRKLSRPDFETAIGLLAIVIAALALWVVSAGGKAARAGNGYMLTARFDQIDGLMRRGLAVPTDSALLVMSDGMLGGKFLRIEAGSETEALKPGERFQTVQDSVIVEQILQKIVQGAEARRRGDEPTKDTPQKNDSPPRPEGPEKKPDAPPPGPDAPKQQ